VLLLAPQAVVHPSFQMSFAATLALIAAYQRGLPWRADADSSVAARAALWGTREIVGLVLASLVAGLATTPYVAFHFHRLAPYGVVANLLAMPVVSAWVMPMGILGLVTYPFGFDDVFWRLMGPGIDWMIIVSVWVTSLPGAVGRVAAFGTGPLLLATAGLLLVCLLRTSLRWSGAGLAAVAAIWVIVTPQPDIYVAGDGQAAALRGADGRLSLLHSGRDSFAVKEWLAADADARLPGDKTLSSGVRCDETGCIGTLRDGRLAAVALAADAFAEDCVRAAVVISQRQLPSGEPSDCQAVLIDRPTWRERGALALRIEGKDFDVRAARPSGEQRPWSQPPRREAAPALQRPASRDATPPASGLEADDQ